jgi:hypothetical protein
MTTPEELAVLLKTAKYKADDSPATAVESAIAIYHNASANADGYNIIKDAAKRLISDVMAKTGQMKYVTLAGTAAVSAPSQTVTYDAKAIDILLRDDADLALRLSPYRKVTERAGTLRITAKK